MNNVSNYLRESAPPELFEFASHFYSDAQLLQTLENDPTRLLSFLTYMKIEANESLAARLIVRVSSNDLENPEVKKIETVLRNQGVFKRELEPDIFLTGDGWRTKIEGHKNILMLESPLFMDGREFIKMSELKQAEMGISEKVFQHLVDYMYLSDEKRKEFVSQVDKSDLIQLERLSGLMGIEELRSSCEEKIYNPLGCFGKREWEKTFPIWIVEAEPPLPFNIDTILEQEDPCEPGKKLKETCMLFLRPRKLITPTGDGPEELKLDFSKVDFLASKIKCDYVVWGEMKGKLKKMPVADAGWVLMRKEIIPGTKNQSFEDQKKLLKGKFVVPNPMDALLFYMLNFVREGKVTEATRCDENSYVGFIKPRSVFVSEEYYDEYTGLLGSWKF